MKFVFTEVSINIIKITFWKIFYFSFYTYTPLKSFTLYTPMSSTKKFKEFKNFKQFVINYVYIQSLKIDL